MPFKIQASHFFSGCGLVLVSYMFPNFKSQITENIEYKGANNFNCLHRNFFYWFDQMHFYIPSNWRKRILHILVFNRVKYKIWLFFTLFVIYRPYFSFLIIRFCCTSHNFTVFIERRQVSREGEGIWLFCCSVILWTLYRQAT